jgi:hypothetical protein
MARDDMVLHDDGYLRFLRERDGEPDFSRHTLARREEFFAGLAAAPVRSAAQVDGAAYLRNLDRRRPAARLDARVLWLLATARANQAERFGVGLAEVYGRITAGSEPVRLHVTLHEIYHTRVLADVVAIFGLPVSSRPPDLATRAITHLMVRTPERWQLPLVGAGEMVGCIVFRMLRDRGRELFAAEPSVTARIGRLLDEILGDELGHVGLIASRLGPRRRALMRHLYRVLALRLARRMPAMAPLFGRRALRLAFSGPFRADAMAAELPGLAYVAAYP